MFGVGLPELAVIAVVAMLVFGPERLPEFARQAAHFVRWMRNFANAARDQVRSELGPEYSDLEIRDLDPRRIVTREISKVVKDLDLADEAARTAAAGGTLGLGERPPYDDDAT